MLCTQGGECAAVRAVHTRGECAAVRAVHTRGGVCCSACCAHKGGSVLQCVLYTQGGECAAVRDVHTRGGVCCSACCAHMTKHKSNIDVVFHFCGVRPLFSHSYFICFGIYVRAFCISCLF